MLLVLLCLFNLSIAASLMMMLMQPCLASQPPTSTHWLHRVSELLRLRTAALLAAVFDR